MVRRASVWICVLIAFCGAVVAGASADKSQPPKEDYYELYMILVDTMDQVERNYVKDVDRRELIEAAIEGVLSKLDPYSAYIGPKELGRFRANVDSEFGGIGIQVTMESGQLQILSPLVGTPAYRAGLMAGDRIVEINGESTTGLTLNEAVRRLKGEEGTSVTLTVIHPGTSKPAEVSIVRETIRIETVLGYQRKEDNSWDFMLEPEHGIGYVRITAFSRDTADELQTALKRLLDQEMRGLILDLRFNPGGLLSSAIEVSDLFVSSGRIVSTKGRNSNERTWEARKEGTFEGFPMVVLVNRYSASASEVVSACLQDSGRAVIMGERTWGKGSVQNVIELENGDSALKLTTASYQRPSGKNIHRFPDAGDEDEWGVMPDEGFRLRLSHGEMMALIHARRQRDIVKPKRLENSEPDQPHGGPTGQSPAGADKSHEGGAADSESQQDAPRAEDKAPADAGDGGKPAENSNGESAEPKFVDRQLKMAIEYLVKRLASEDQ